MVIILLGGLLLSTLFHHGTLDFLPINRCGLQHGKQYVNHSFKSHLSIGAYSHSLGLTTVLLVVAGSVLTDCLW